MKRFRSMAYPYVFWIAIFIVIPMLLIIAYAFTVEGTARSEERRVGKEC